jgi:endo-1,4-beta-xylanase
MSPGGWTRRGALAAAASLGCSQALAQGGISLKAVAADRGLLLGCAVEPDILASDRAFADLVQAQCSQVTPENALKWIVVQPGDGAFDFAQADRLLVWAEARRIRIYGHCLVWHEALPVWVRSRLTPADAPELMARHIAAVVGRYRGRIRAWDVVIEAVERADERPDGLRRSPWLQAMGPDYIAQAFRLAHAADPQARLALADYGLEYDGVPWMTAKRRAVLRLLEALKAGGAPVHVLNIQAHLLGGEPPSFGAPLRTFLADVADLGLDIAIGELDVEDQAMTGSPAERDARTADISRRFLDVVLDEPAVKSIGLWGLSDRYTAKRLLAPRPDHDERPLPFDRDLRPKPAALAMARALAEAPWRQPAASGSI